MQDESNDIGSPTDWLKRARSNLIRAGQSKHEKVFWEDLCFDAQQAVEKALKALLIYHNMPFRFVHDIAELLTVLENNGIELPANIRKSAELTDYAVGARYPGPMEPVTEDEYKDAVDIAEKVILWVESFIEVEPENKTDTQDE